MKREISRINLGNGIESSMADVIRENAFDLFGPLASDIHKLLFIEQAPEGINYRPASVNIFDDNIPAIDRLVKDRHSSESENAQQSAAHVNFDVKNYIGKAPDNYLNLAVAAEVFGLAEAARQRQLVLA